MSKFSSDGNRKGAALQMTAPDEKAQVAGLVACLQDDGELASKSMHAGLKKGVEARGVAVGRSAETPGATYFKTQKRRVHGA